MEIKKRVHHYRGHKIKYVTNTSDYVIENGAGNPIGTYYQTVKDAQDYIDALLDE